MSAILVLHKPTISKLLVTPRALLFNIVQGIYQKTSGTIMLQ